MTSTLLYDTLFILNSKRPHVPTAQKFESGPRYDSLRDPFYVTNLDEPIDAFIVSALEGTQFKNIVHIMLESMRQDSFPWQEGGILDRHIKEYMEPPESPINLQTMTPFVDSISSNVLSWDTMWCTIPYTLKAMLGRNFRSYNPLIPRLLRDAPYPE
jgi:hypothetical protein